MTNECVFLFFQKKIEKQLHPKILIAPLNWGLGHATRCIPIIRELIEQGADVFIGSDGAALKLLREEFPHLTHLELPAYNIHYKTSNMFFNMATQLPGIWGAIRQEHSVLSDLYKKYQFSAIISDNRFGCFHPKVHSIFLTHQVNIKTPFIFTNKIINYFNHRFIKKFNTCWVPDFEKGHRISGELSNGNIKKEFIGNLSRFKHKTLTKKYDAAIVLSGPEPQRTFLEEEILNQIKNINLSFILIKGKVETSAIRTENNVDIISYMTSTDLNQVFLESRFVIARSGYSTIMDLAKTKNPALLIPTPGQTEQEYLADYYSNQNIFITQKQGALNISKALDLLQKGDYGFKENFKNNILKNKIKNLLTRIT